MCHVGAHNPGPKPGLGYSAFARRYLRNRVCFLFLWVLRCFSSPGSPLCPMHSDTGDPPLDGTGCPIRKSQDHRSITNFPGLIAGFHVLHRLSTPRHPPYALVRLGHADPIPANGPRPFRRPIATPQMRSISSRLQDIRFTTCQRAGCEPASRRAHNPRAKSRPRLPEASQDSTLEGRVNLGKDRV